MEQVTSALTQIKEINNAYDLPVDNIEKLEGEIAEAKVCTPVIGMFSSGKSRLINIMLGYPKKILKEGINPMTYVPTEIIYTNGEDKVSVYDNNGLVKVISIEDYRNIKPGAIDVNKVRIELHNTTFLERIPDVMLVDMPGFGSGLKFHDRAIDDYQANSLAYIIAFPADDLVLYDSVGTIIKELCLHDMPICVVITKYDKKNSGYKESYEKLKMDITKCLGGREVDFCETYSFSNDAEELEVFLEGIQKKSQEILENKYKKSVLPIIEITENYLKTILNGSSLTESELAGKKESLEKEASEIGDKITNKQNDFDKEVKQCIEEIKGDVKVALEAEESFIVNLVLDKKEINEPLKAIVRKAITESIKKRFVPRLDKYIKDINKIIDSEKLGDVGAIPFHFDLNSIKNGILSNVLVGIAAFFLGPLFGGILTAIYIWWNKNAWREKARQEIEQKLRTEAYPYIIRVIDEKLHIAIQDRVKLVNDTIENDFKRHKESLEKAIDDLNREINNEKLSKEEQINKAQAYLNEIEEIKNVLQ